MNRRVRPAFLIALAVLGVLLAAIAVISLRGTGLRRMFEPESAAEAPAARSRPAPDPALPPPASAEGPKAYDESQGGIGGVFEEGPNLFEEIARLHALSKKEEVTAFFARNAELAARHVERFCEESRRLPRRGLFPDSRRQRDAAAWLAPRIDWEGAPPVKGTLQPPSALAERVDSAGKAWLEALADADLSGLDFSWMRELRGYDSWNLAAAGPLKDHPPEKLLDAPLPLYAFFTRWIKLRFAQALRDGSLVDASLEARHLAELLHSQGVLIGEMFSVAVLRLEREAWAAAAGRGLAPAGWTPPDAEELEGHRRLARISHHFFLPGVDPEVMRRARGCLPAPCSALTEAAFVHAAMGELAPTDTRGAFWPFVEELTGCDRGLLDLVRSSPTIPAADAARAYGGQPALLDETFKAKKP